jgi:hypothetical protein
MIDKVEKGEIVYCNLKVEYIRKNFKFKKVFYKELNECIFARKYDCDKFPYLDVIKYSMLINKIDRKNAYYISKVKIVNLSILARTGYISDFNK